MKKNIKKISLLWVRLVSKSITAKFDVLVMQVPEIVEKNEGYTGALSEQSIERLHNVVNHESRALHNISDKAKKAECIMKVY